jgi:hypothetical protein
MPRGVPASGKRNTKKSAEEIRRIAANAAKTQEKPATVPLAEQPNAATNVVNFVPDPICIPAPQGTFILHAKKVGDKGIVINLHVCTHFERFPDRLVPRGMIPAGDDVIEAAVLHPTGHVSGSPKMPITFENTEQFRQSLIQRYVTPPKADAGQEVRAHRRINTNAKPAAEEPEEDLIG